MKDVAVNHENIRHLLMQSAVAVLSGRLSAKDANALSNLVGEIHKSVKLEIVENMIEERMIPHDTVVEAIKHVK